MSRQIDRLEQQIQQIQQWVAERINSSASNGLIQASLEDLKQSIQAGKLVLNIVSSDQAQAQAFCKLLRFGDFCQQQFVSQIVPLPENFDFEIDSCLPGLVLQNEASPTRHDLSVSDSLLLGRNPHKAKILFAGEWDLVSGVHAELQPLSGGGWQIQDCDSRNGTYINGQKSKGWHRLEAGDRLCLGSADGQEGSLTLVYDQPKTAHFSPALVAIHRIFNCNALCLVIDVSQPLAEAAKHLLEQANKTPIQKTVVVAAMPRGAAPDAVSTHLAEIQSWLGSSSLYGSVELVSLSLDAILPRPGATQIMPYAQPEFEQLCRSLAELANGNLEEMTLQRAMAQTQIQLSALESVLNEQVLVLKSRMQQDEERLKSLTYGNLKEQFNRIWTRISGEKDQIFRQVKSELNQSKSSVLDEFRRSSLPARIKRFVKLLKPLVVDQGGYRHIRLRLRENVQRFDSNSSVHLEIIHLCRSYLSTWATEEWRQICTVYGNGGLRNFAQRSYESFNIIPNLKMPPDLFQTSELPDVQAILQPSVMESPSGIRYKQMGVFGYLFKNIKGQVISGLALLMLVGSVFIDGNDLPKNFKAEAAGPLLIGFTISLIWTYQQEKRVKVEEGTEKLRKETADYYCSLTKSQTERVSQHLNFVLENEERRLRETLETAKELFTASLNDLEKNQLQLKTQIEEGRKTQQRIISKDIPEIQQMKRSLLNAPNENQSARAEVSRRNPDEAPLREKRPSSSHRREEAS